MKISIAGAGAGKTTTMADTIVNLQSEMNSHLNIFCITFTNNAVACIERKLKKHYDELDRLTIFITSQVETKYGRRFTLDYFERAIGSGK